MRRAAALVAAAAAAEASLQSTLQAVLDKQLAGTGLAASVGWKSADVEFSITAGQAAFPNGSSRPVTPQDTFLYGSGTKTYTAACVMRLVEEGKLSLSDTLGEHVDSVMEKLGGKSMAGYFGANAAKMTVELAMSMRTGLPDFDQESFDDTILRNQSSLRHSPVEFIEYTATLAPICDPGECVFYASGNYVLLGLVLLRFTDGWSDWSDIDELSMLPQSVVAADFAGSHFIQDEALSAFLTVPGSGGNGPHTEGGPVTIFDQSATIMGWTCSNMVAPSLDVARFFWDMVGPAPRVVSPASLATMQEWRDVTSGWGHGSLRYGAGLMLNTVSHGMAPTEGALGVYLGHGGNVFGFNSAQGYFYGLNASVAIVVNSDSPGSGNGVTCAVIQAAATELLGANASSLGCNAPRPPSYDCDNATRTCSKARHHGQFPSMQACQQRCA